MNLEERVARLEKLLTSKVLGSADQTVRTSRLELVSAGGKIEAVLSPASKGGGVAIADQLGGNKTVIGVGDRGPELILTTRDGGNGIRLNITPKGEVLFGMYDANHKPRVTFSVLPSHPAIDLRDERGKVRLSLMLQTNGDGTIDIVNSAGRSVLVAGPGEAQGIGPFFRMTDAQGAARVIMSVSGSGEPSITLAGPDGKSLAMLSIGANGNGLTFYDGEGNPRGVLGIGSNGTPELGFFSDLGKRRISIANTPNLTGMVINDSNEAARIHVSVDTDERPLLSVIDPSGACRVKVMVLPDGSPSISLHDAEGRYGLLLTTRSDGSGLTLSDPRGKPRALLTLGPEGPSLILTDESGECTFHAP